MMDKIKEVILGICPDVDLDGDAKLVTDKIVDSIDLVSIISDLADEFGVSIDTEEIVPENFDSVASIWAMLERLQK